VAVAVVVTVAVSVSVAVEVAVSVAVAVAVEVAIVIAVGVADEAHKLAESSAVMVMLYRKGDFKLIISGWVQNVWIVYIRCCVT
jgi:hypothetical protein